MGSNADGPDGEANPRGASSDRAEEPGIAATAVKQARPTEADTPRRAQVSRSHRRRQGQGSGDGDVLIAQYLSEISKVELLTPEQETALARRIEAGKIAEERLSVMGQPEPGLETELMRVVEDGLRAKRMMIEANLRLVVSIAKHYARNGVSMLDLIQEGNIGLIRAVERFDYRLGYRFSTYATWWIKQSIRRALSEQARTVRIPAHVADDVARVRNVYNVLAQQMGREPLPEEVAPHVMLSVDRVRELMAVNQSPISLDTPLGDGESSTLADIICDDLDDTPQELITRRLLKEHMVDAMDDLTPREREVLKMRFGLDGERPRTLEEVGQTMRVTRERVRQIEARCLAKLRHPSRAKHLREYLQ
jgi:RNA polymerase primary sigma factor